MGYGVWGTRLVPIVAAMAFDPRAYAARYAVGWRTVGVSRCKPTGLMCGASDPRGAVRIPHTHTSYPIPSHVGSVC